MGGKLGAVDPRCASTWVNQPVTPPCPHHSDPQGRSGRPSARLPEPAPCGLMMRR